MSFRVIDDEEAHNPNCDMCGREVDLEYECYYDFDGFYVCEDCLPEYTSDHRSYDAV